MANAVNNAGSSPSPSDFEQLLRDQGVTYCLAAFVDVHGIPKAKSVPLHHFQRMMRGSELFTGAALEGLGQGPQDDELAIHPNPNAITVLPWRPEVAWAPGNLKYQNEPWPMCSRTILTKSSLRHGITESVPGTLRGFAMFYLAKISLR